jgi:hypothetical protein
MASQLTGPLQRDKGATTTLVAKDAVPALGELEQTSMEWVEQVWGALNQGLEDFEHNAQVADWEAYAINVLGNLLWATAAFATGGSAFLISAAGIALSSKAAASSVSSMGDFHNLARADHDSLLAALKQHVPRVTKMVHNRASESRWSSRKTYRILMQLLLKRSYVTTVGGVPTVNSARIAAHVEHELLLRAGASPSTSWAGWKRGDWWLVYEYRVDNAILSWNRIGPFSEWKLKREKGDATLLPIDTAVRQARDRLNALQSTLGGPHRPREWPIRKMLKVYFQGSSAVEALLDAGNRYRGAAAWYLDREQTDRLGTAAGWGDVGRGLVDWVWTTSGGEPPDIDKIR